MGWLNGKKLIIRPADGATKSLDNEPHHVQGRLLVAVSVHSICLPRAAQGESKRRSLCGDDRHQFGGSAVRGPLYRQHVPVRRVLVFAVVF